MSGVGPEKPNPGSEGTTRSNAIAGSRPCPRGSLSGPSTSRYSATEPGQPWLSTSGSASGSMEPVISGQTRIVQAVQKRQPCNRPFRHGHGHGVVQPGDGVGGDPHQQLVQGDYSRPVGVRGAWRSVVDRGDGGLELVRADGAAGQGAGKQGQAALDGPGLPPGPVLLVERHEVAVLGRTGGGTRVSEQEERQQPGGLAVVRQ